MEIIGYPNYLIYEDGRVYNKKFNRPLKAINSKKGYRNLWLSHNGIKKLHKIHRLVAIHYIPNPQNLPVVDHIDRNTLNNHISNLRWVSFQGNSHNQKKMPHSIAKGVRISPNGKYRAYISFVNKETNQRDSYSKTFPTLEEAIRHRKMLEAKYFVV